MPSIPPPATLAVALRRWVAAVLLILPCGIAVASGPALPQALRPVLEAALDNPRDALALLRALDPDDCVGAALLEAVRQRSLAGAGADGEGDDTVYVQATGAAAWARLPGAA